MNAFDAFGQAHSRKEKPRRLPMAPVTPEEKRQAEDAARMKRYRRLVNEERTVAYALPGGAEAQAVVRWAGKMGLGDGDVLIAKVGRIARRLDKATKRRLLADLDEAMCKLRLRSGMAEIDDPIFDEPESVFQAIKRLLT